MSTMVDSLEDYLYSTETAWYFCPICCEQFKDSHEWVEPHPCGKRFHDNEFYVCSEECAEDWRKAYSDECLDWEIKQEEKKHALCIEKIKQKYER